MRVTLKGMTDAVQQALRTRAELTPEHDACRVERVDQSAAHSPDVDARLEQQRVRVRIAGVRELQEARHGQTLPTVSRPRIEQDTGRRDGREASRSAAGTARAV